MRSRWSDDFTVEAVERRSTSHPRAGAHPRRKAAQIPALTHRLSGVKAAQVQGGESPSPAHRDGPRTSSKLCRARPTCLLKLYLGFAAGVWARPIRMRKRPRVRREGWTWLCASWIHTYRRRRLRLSRGLEVVPRRGRSICYRRRRGERLDLERWRDSAPQGGGGGRDPAQTTAPGSSNRKGTRTWLSPSRCRGINVIGR